MATGGAAPNERRAWDDDGPGDAAGERLTPAEVERRLADLAGHVRFRVTMEGDVVEVRVLDAHSDRVVRRIPAPELLEVRRRLERAIGRLADEAA